MQSTKFTRWHAAAVHACICLIVAAVLFCLFRFVWYPYPTMQALGGANIFLILVVADFIIGPLLTLVVYKAGKKSLSFDLAVIATIQIAALLYGLSVLFAGRPVYIAGVGHRFDLIQANEIDPANLEKAHQRLPLWGPEWVGIHIPETGPERNRLFFEAFSNGVDFGHYPQLHAPLESMREKLLQKADTIAALKKLNPTKVNAINAWLSDHGYTDETAVYQGMKARAEDMAIILDAKSAKVIGIAPFTPW